MQFRPIRLGNQQYTVLGPPIVKTNFGRLRRFGMFHMQSAADHKFANHTEMVVGAVKAQQELIAYGAAAEQVCK